MHNLKTLFDAARAAEAKVQQVLTDMLGAFEEGTEEGKAKALELRPALDAAKQEADAANQLYISARDADAGDPDEAARKFVPAGEREDGEKPKTMTRAEFEALSAADKMSFMLADGRIVE
jgi:hypothetical protein